MVPEYDHSIVAWEQVVRSGTVEKTISSVGVVVVIWAKVREEEGGKEKAKIYLGNETVSLVE